MKQLKRPLAMLLSVLMLFNVLYLPAFAASGEGDAPLKALPSGSYWENVEFENAGDTWFYMATELNLPSGRLTPVFTVWPDTKITTDAQAQAYLLGKGFIQMAEEQMGVVILMSPSGDTWSEADVETYWTANSYIWYENTAITPDADNENPAPEGSIGAAVGAGVIPHVTYLEVQYFVGEGSGATFINQYMSQNAHRAAGVLTVGGTMPGDVGQAMACPAYLVDGTADAVNYWKTKNHISAAAKATADFTVDGADVYMDAATPLQKVVVEKESAELNYDLLAKAWDAIFKRTGRRSMETRMWDTNPRATLSREVNTLMDQPVPEELGLQFTAVDYDNVNDTVFRANGSGWFEWVPNEAVPGNAGYDADEKFPLVVVLHGNNDHPKWEAESNGWVKKAGEERFMVFAPSTITYTRADSAAEGVSVRLPEFLEKYPNVDLSRVYVTGFSAGGNNTYTNVAGFAVDGEPSKFAAMAPVAAPGAGGNGFGDENVEAMKDVMDIGYLYVIPNDQDTFGNGPLFNAEDLGFHSTTDRFAGQNGSKDPSYQGRNNLNRMLKLNDIDVELPEQDFDKYPVWGFDRGTVKTFTDAFGKEYKVSGWKNAAGVELVKMATFEGMNHNHMNTYAEIIWDYFKQFSRNTTTGELIYRENLPFRDVAEDAWYGDAVRYAYENGLFLGTGAATFAPETSVTRAMLWTALYRRAGAPAAADTDAGSLWYGAARKWALEQGLSDGTDPAGTLTREQLATILYRQAGSPAVDHTALAEFSDAANISDFALDAMCWAVGTGLLKGNGGELFPLGGATRAEAAALLMRLDAAAEAAQGSPKAPTTSSSGGSGSSSGNDSSAYTVQSGANGVDITAPGAYTVTLLLTGGGVWNLSDGADVTRWFVNAGGAASFLDTEGVAAAGVSGGTLTITIDAGAITGFGRNGPDGLYVLPPAEAVTREGETYTPFAAKVGGYTIPALTVDSNLLGSAYTYAKSTQKAHLGVDLAFSGGAAMSLALNGLDVSKIGSDNAGVALAEGDGYHVDEYVFTATDFADSWADGEAAYTIPDGAFDLDRTSYPHTDADSGHEWSCLGGDGQGNYSFNLTVGGLTYNGLPVAEQTFRLHVYIYGFDYTADAVKLYSENGQAAPVATQAPLENAPATGEAPQWTWVNNYDGVQTRPVLCDALSDNFYITWPGGTNASGLTSSDVAITLHSRYGDEKTLTAGTDYTVFAGVPGETQIALTYTNWAFVPVYDTMTITVKKGALSAGETFDVASVWVYEAQQGGGGTKVDGTVTAYSFFGLANLTQWGQLLSPAAYTLKDAGSGKFYSEADGGKLVDTAAEATVYDASGEEEQNLFLKANTLYTTARVDRTEEKTVNGSSLTLTKTYSGGKLLAPTACDQGLEPMAGYAIPWDTANWITNEKWAWQPGIELAWTGILDAGDLTRATMSFHRGDTLDFSDRLIGVENRDVTWSLRGDVTSRDTVLTENGVLTVGADETCPDFAVVAMRKDAPGVYGRGAIIISAK